VSGGVETFLDAGKPPVYFGFGSICAPEGLSKTMIE
jgi:vancomycin aglycone glucosyltransferase